MLDKLDKEIICRLILENLHRFEYLNSKDFYYHFRHELDNPTTLKLAYKKFAIKNKDNKLDLNQCKNLLFWGDMGIGNFIQHLIFFKSIKIYSNLKITVIFSSINRMESEIAKNCKYIDNIIFMQGLTNSTSKIIELLYKININFDILIFKFNKSSIIPILIGVIQPKYIIGHSSGENFINKYDDCFNKKIPFLFNNSETQNALNLAVPIIGIKDENTKIIDFNDVFKKNTIKKYFINTTTALKLRNKKYVVISPFVAKSQKWKEWPFKYFHELMVELISQNYYIVITGATEDFAMINNFIKKNKYQKFISNYCGKNIFTIFPLLEKCQFSISNDSSLQHLSSIANNKHYSIIGPSDHERSLPKYENIYYINSACKCNTNSILNVLTLKAVEDCKDPCLFKLNPKMVLESIKRDLIGNARILR